MCGGSGVVIVSTPGVSTASSSATVAECVTTPAQRPRTHRVSFSWNGMLSWGIALWAMATNRVSPAACIITR